MASHSCVPYRGHGIEVHVSPDPTGTLGANVVGFALRWTVSSPDAPHDELISFAEQCVFISEFDALTYGEARAHSFIDHMLSLPASTKDAADKQGSTEQTSRS
ncbi:hypothetical protein [Paraburkholderia metrosideri]|jgi:hypothetical protein|uniref:Uncharacterized protein n=1 Tax=Paraburkholderia metrosideri TaxID=580937 RepID=A0ABN7HZ65_9BURK|nr:hypothetical protein [Paraburkholderia metrosideri]CAD6545642.1 hypothetical protein LMG28140_04200 [Paraburkholderia metrosideri]